MKHSMKYAVYFPLTFIISFILCMGVKGTSSVFAASFKKILSGDSISYHIIISYQQQQQQMPNKLNISEK